jgi:hypothetical protein
MLLRLAPKPGNVESGLTHSNLFSRNSAGRSRGCMVGLVALFVLVSALAASGFGKAQESRWQEVDTEHIFGFTEGANIGGKGEKELENTTIGHFGRPGSFTVLTNEADFRYGLEEHFRASFGVLADYHDIHGVRDLTDRTALNFGGLSSEFRWQLMQRDVSPVDLTLSFAPQWQRIDDTGGRVESYAFPIALLVDTALAPSKMFAAANLIYTPATHANSAPLEFSPAIAAAVTDSVFLGAEIRHITRNQNGFFTGHALFIGPSVFVNLSESVAFKVAWTAQIPDETTHRLDMVNFERHQVLAVLVKSF